MPLAFSMVRPLQCTGLSMHQVVPVVVLIICDMVLGLVSDKVTTAFSICDFLRQIFFIFFFRALHPMRYKFLIFAIIRT